MNIEHIRTFLEIASTRNFHRAAERLHVTQSTVSARIKALEQQLDRSLFTRNRNGATLTAAGHHFQRHAVAAVRAWGQARQEVTLPEGFRDSFALGTVTTGLWERFGIRWIRKMRRAAPDVALRLDVDYSEDLLRNLSDGLLDIGVMYQPRSSPGLVVENLFKEKLVLVSTEKHTIRDDWMRQYVFVNWGYNYRAQHYEAFPEMPAPAISLGVSSLGLRYLLEIGGAAYLSLNVVRRLVAEGRLFRVKGAPVFSRPSYVVYPESPTDPDIMQLALNTLHAIASVRSRTKRTA